MSIIYAFCAGENWIILTICLYSTNLWSRVGSCHYMANINFMINCSRQSKLKIYDKLVIVDNDMLMQTRLMLKLKHELKLIRFIFGSSDKDNEISSLLY